jgi:hypothetical protein
MVVCCSPCNTHMKVYESAVRLEACRTGRWVALGIPVWVLLSGSCMCRCDWCRLGTGSSCTHAGWGRDYRYADNHRSTAIVTTAGIFTKYATTWSKQPRHEADCSIVWCNCRDHFTLSLPAFEKSSQIEIKIHINSFKEIYVSTHHPIFFQGWQGKPEGKPQTSPNFSSIYLIMISVPRTHSIRR